MNLSLYSGATGMQAQQMNLNVISNNIANVIQLVTKKIRLSFRTYFIKTLVNLVGRLVLVMWFQLVSKWETVQKLFQLQKSLLKGS
jgi:hypothetical protein